MILLLTLLEGQTLLDIPHFKNLSPFLESSEINHETFEIQGQNGALSFMVAYVLSICKSEIFCHILQWLFNQSLKQALPYFLFSL